MKYITTMIAVAAMSCGGCAWLGFPAEEPVSIGARLIDTEHAVDQLLAGRSLDAVEGAWEHDGSSFEVVISRDTFGVAPGFDYVGVMTRSDRPDWHHGDVKLMLRKTDRAGVFDGVWLTGNRAKRKMTFVSEQQDLLQASFVSKDGHSYFLRMRRLPARLSAVL